MSNQNNSNDSMMETPTPEATLEAGPEAEEGKDSGVESAVASGAESGTAQPGKTEDGETEDAETEDAETENGDTKDGNTAKNADGIGEYAGEADNAEPTPEASPEAEEQPTAETGATPTATVETTGQTVAAENTAGKAQAGGSGGMWIWIIVVLVVAVAAVFAVKRFVLDDRKRSKRGRARYIRDGAGARTPGDRKPAARPAARPAGGIDKVKSTMVEDDIPVQSQYSVGYAQWIGNREDQEDACAVTEWRNADVVAHRGILAAVADGIGGLDDGQIASQTMMQSLWDGFEKLDPGMSPQDRLLELMANGQREVVNINRRGKRCGTTLVAALVKGGYLSIISVGDSRIALYRSGVLLQLNREHVNARVRDEQSALYGAARVEGNRRVALTSYIGKEDLQELDRTLNPIQLVSGDRVLLMSDGVFGTLTDDQLVALLDQEPQQAADAIIEEVKMQQKQYQDNATVVIVAVK